VEFLIAGSENEGLSTLDTLKGLIHVRHLAASLDSLMVSSHQGIELCAATFLRCRNPSELAAYRNTESEKVAA